MSWSLPQLAILQMGQAAERGLLDRLSEELPFRYSQPQRYPEQQHGFSRCVFRAEHSSVPELAGGNLSGVRRGVQTCSSDAARYPKITRGQLSW